MKSLKNSTVFIIGLGQIGGSIGLDLVGHMLVNRVIGYDINKNVMRLAKKIKAVDSTVHSINTGVKQADIIIIAAPIRKILKLLRPIYRQAKKHQIILDVGGTKSEMFNAISDIESSASFIGGHPIAGTEKAGIDGAQRNLFANINFILTPAVGVGPGNLSKIKSLVRKLGANPIIMTPPEHDRLIAVTSHIPYALSLAMMNLAFSKNHNSKKLQLLIGGSFKSVTRVAMSSPILTLDMFKTNQKELTKAIDLMIQELATLKRFINSENESQLRSIIIKARKKRKEFSNG